MRLAVLLTIGLITSGFTACDPPVPKPDVVFVMLDDARLDEVEAVADLKPDGGFAWMRDHATRFDRMHSTNNLCCPGRATALTGQTSYNHGVMDNSTYADFPESLPVWAQEAGYCTGFTGKYLNTYNATRPRPPGWTFWEPMLPYYNDEFAQRMLARDGTKYTTTTYQTDHLASVSQQQVADCHALAKPAFVTLWAYPPHFGSDPEPDYADVSVGYSNTDPVFDEADVSDKPAWISGLPPVNGSPAAWHQHHVRTLMSVDDALMNLIDDDTVIVLGTDNGLMNGEHRVVQRKMFAYDAAQPFFWIAGPGFTPSEDSRYATNLDIAPTLDKAMGGSHSGDGIPLQDLDGRDRALPIRVAADSHPAGDGVRTKYWKYVHYDDGTEELYDLLADGYELENQANNPAYAAQKAALIALQAQAQACQGDTCRVPITLGF